MPDVVSLPQHFKNHGYTTISLGKIFHHSEREPGDDPDSWSQPPWYHGEPYKHWFSQASLDYVKRLKALPKDEQPKQLRAAPSVHLSSEVLGSLSSRDHSTCFERLEIHFEPTPSVGREA